MFWDLNHMSHLKIVRKCVFSPWGKCHISKVWQNVGLALLCFVFKHICHWWLGMVANYQFIRARITCYIKSHDRIISPVWFSRRWWWMNMDKTEEESSSCKQYIICVFFHIRYNSFCLIDVGSESSYLPPRPVWNPCTLRRKFRRTGKE